LRLFELALGLLDFLVDAGLAPQIGERAPHALQGGCRLTRDLRQALAEHEDRDHEDHDQLGEGKPEELHVRPGL